MCCGVVIGLIGFGIFQFDGCCIIGFKIGSMMVNKLFEWCSLLWGVGVFIVVLLVFWVVGCVVDDDDVLIFFFVVNLDEFCFWMCVVNEFQWCYFDIKVWVLLFGFGVMQQFVMFCVGGKCLDVLMVWELIYVELVDWGVLFDLNMLLVCDQVFVVELKLDSIGVLYEIFMFNGGQYVFLE